MVNWSTNLTRETVRPSNTADPSVQRILIGVPVAPVHDPRCHGDHLRRPNRFARMRAGAFELEVAFAKIDFRPWMCARHGLANHDVGRVELLVEQVVAVRRGNFAYMCSWMGRFVAVEGICGGLVGGVE